jgi:hypothetical protein
MTTLKTIGIIGASMLALSTVTATPVLAQPWGYAHRDHDRTYVRNYDRRLNSSYVDSLSWRIDDAARRGMISWRQARSLHAQLRQVQPIAYRVQTGRASTWEYRRLSNVVNRIEAATRTYAMNRPVYGGWRR